MSDTTKLDVSAMIDSLEELAAISNMVEDGDYIGDNGLLHCGKCHTPKQSRVVILGRERTPFCLCKCMEEAENARRKAEELQQKMHKYKGEAFDDNELLKWTFANDDGADSKTMNVAKKYVENFPKFLKDGKGLLFYGKVGTGKTYAAASIVNALIEQGYPCRATKFTTIANELGATFDKKQEYLNRFKRYALLVIDDLGVERNSEYMKEIVWSVIDSRYLSGLPLIVTSNLSIDEIKKPQTMADQRIYSRIIEMCHPVSVDGADRRKKKVRSEYSEISDLLGT